VAREDEVPSFDRLVAGIAGFEERVVGASWATEISLQSGCPGGSLSPKSGATPPPVGSDAWAMQATTPFSAKTVPSK
jgi:hypothetical protein